jgi:hypothetical protein
VVEPTVEDPGRGAPVRLSLPRRGTQPMTSNAPSGPSLANRPLSEPSTARLPLDEPRRAEALARHADAMREGAPGYLDPATGLFVLTAQYLADRGICCDTGCRHCPYTP